MRAIYTGDDCVSIPLTKGMTGEAVRAKGFDDPKSPHCGDFAFQPTGSLHSYYVFTDDLKEAPEL